MELPLAPVELLPAMPAADAVPIKAKRVLVIEDNDDGRDMLVAALRLHGHEVFAAATGREGIAEAMLRAPNVVLVDLGLRDIQGYDVAQELRRKLHGMTAGIDASPTWPKAQLLKLNKTEAAVSFMTAAVAQPRILRKLRSSWIVGSNVR